MLKIRRGNQFKRDIRLMERRGKDLDKIFSVILMLSNETPLPEQYKDHMLVGNYRGHRECHIEADWLLIYRIEENFLYLYKTGTHSDIFKK